MVDWSLKAGRRSYWKRRHERTKGRTATESLRGPFREALNDQTPSQQMQMGAWGTEYGGRSPGSARLAIRLLSCSQLVHFGRLPHPAKQITVTLF